MHNIINYFFTIQYVSRLNRKYKSIGPAVINLNIIIDNKDADHNYIHKFIVHHMSGTNFTSLFGVL